MNLEGSREKKFGIFNPETKTFFVVKTEQEFRRIMEMFNGLGTQH